MHDRPSVCPPARFLGTSESLDDSANFTANNENVKSVYAFGEVAATAVTSAWKNVNKLWSGTSETPKRPALLFEPLPPSSYSEGLSALFDDPPERHESPQKPYEDVSNHHEDLPKPYEDISNRHEDLPKPYENIPKHDEDLPEPYENVPKDHEDLSEPYEDVPKDPEDLPKPYEDVPKDHEDLSKLYENVPKDYESLSDLYEHNLKDQESLSKPYEEPPKQHEGLQECQETGKRDSGIEMSPDMPKPMTIKFATPISRDASLDYTSEQEDRKPSLLNRPSLHSLKTVTSRFNLRARTRSARPELEAPTESVASSSMKSVKSKASRSKLKKIDKKVERLQRQLEKAQAERTLLTVDGVNIDDEKASTKENVRTFSVGKKRKTEEAEVGQAGEEHATLPSALKKRKSGKSLFQAECTRSDLTRSSRAEAQAVPQEWRPAGPFAIDAPPPVPKVPAKYQRQVARVSSRKGRKQAVKKEEWNGWDEEVF